jgi:hypothetical protein
MSGIRSHNFRQGDRSEYLGVYLLSGLGLVTTIQRQEDIGFDFYCQLSDQETGNLSFGFPFLLQAKSSDTEKITYGHPDPEKWKVENVNWLFRLEIPLFVGIIHKKEMRIDIYNTSHLNFVYYEFSNASALELLLRNDPDTKNLKGIHKEQLSNWPVGKGDGYKYLVDLGNPIITIENDDFSNVELLKKKKGILKTVVWYEQLSLVYKKLGIPYFFWTHQIETNVTVTPAWMHQARADGKIDALFAAIAPSLISLAINLKANGRIDDALNMKEILSKIPEGHVPLEVKETFPDLFT